MKMVLTKALTSSQYINRGQITVTILDVISPAHFVVKESPTLNASSEAKNFLEAEEAMQKYYESLEPCFFQLPLKDSIIVVFHEKKFYRARVIRILTQSAGHLFKVYLVDYGVECSVPRECIYEIERDFLDHPCQAVDLKLLGIEPISLLMSATDLTMSYGPVTYWDPSAQIYVHDLQKGMCSAYVEVKAVDEEYVYGSLFICYNDNTVKCINDELIFNKFAQFDNSCWEKVIAHKTDDILDNNILTKSSATKSSSSEHVNPKQMSSSVSPSKTEPEFQDLTTMFMRPDGKVIARSSFTKVDAPDSLPEVKKENSKPQEQKIDTAVSPTVPEAVSPEQKTLNHARFQKLQMLSRKRCSPDVQNHLSNNINKSTSVVESKVLKENVSHVTVDITESNSVKLNITKSEKNEKNNISSGSDSNVNSHNLSSQSNVVNSMNCGISKNKSKKESPEQVDAIACKRFQKLQKLCKKRQTHFSQSNVQSASSMNISNVGNCFSEVPSDRTENSSVYSNVDKSEESFNNNIARSKPNISSDNNSKSVISKDMKCVASTTSSTKEENYAELSAQLKNCDSKLNEIGKSVSPVVSVAVSPEQKALNRTRFQKLQVLSRKRCSPGVQSHLSNNINKSSSVVESKVLKENASGVTVDIIESNSVKLNITESEKTDKNSISSSSGSNVNSHYLSSQSNVVNNMDCGISENKLKLESSPQVDAITWKRFQKLQELCRKRQTHFSQSNEQSASSMNIPNAGNSFSEVSSDRTENSSIYSNINKSGESFINNNVLTSEPIITIDSDNSKSDSLQPLVSEEMNFDKPKIKKLPLHKSKRHSDSSDLEVSPMEPQQSEILNELLVMSDSDDLLCSMSNKKNENICDKGHVEENYIELSTQLKHSDPELIDFNELSLWEKQKVPALLIGIGLTCPVLNVEEAKFSKHVLQVLKNINFYGPSCIQSVIWPSMDKNRCIVAVAPPHSGKTVSYMLPLVSSFTEEEVHKPHDNGPSTIVLCSSWLKAQAVYDLFHFFLRDKKMNIITLCTDGGHYRHRVVSLINSCDVLIATPYCLLQFLRDNSVKFSQLENFILDDCTALMNKHKKELKNILLSYIYGAKRSMNTPQLMLFAERWNRNFHVILDKMMSNPLIFFTSFLESAVFAKVTIYAHVCEPERKKNILLGVVKEVGKVVICTTNIHDAVDVHHFLRCEDVRTFFVNEEMEHYIADEVIKDWKSIKCMATSDCLVITDQALIKMCISNADCLIHYDIPPESRLQFGNRFSCIAEHFQKTKPACVSHILITESEYYYAPQIIKIIENSGGTPPEDLIELSKKQDQAESTSDSNDLLCPYMKAFGFCKEHLCKNRHVIDAEKDKPQVIPSEGDFQGLVTYIVHASHYYVRLLKYLDPVTDKTVSLISTYAEIGFQLRDFYSFAPADLEVQSPVIGGIYVLAEENNLFYRIEVLKEINSDSPTALPSWKVLFLDEGWIKCYEKPKLYKLSDQIKLPEPIAVEVYVCNIITPDSCFDWNPQTSQLVSDLIKGKEIHGKIALCLGKTLLVDPIALVLHLSNTNEYVNLFKLNQKLLECGHARQNKNHLVMLRQACAGKIPLPTVAKRSNKKENKVVEQTPEINYAFLECNAYEDVYVSSVISPHQLYVQRAKFVECLDNLLDKINEQVEKRTLKKAYTLYKGLHCIAPFYEDDRYYRAVITDIVSYTEVQLFYVDFGDSGKVSRSNIYCLPAEFLLLPFQAIECELAGIAAAHGGWTDSSVDALMTLTRDEAGDMKILQLKAYIKSSCYDGGNHYVIDLWFNEKNLSEQLLQAGFGVPTEVPVIQSSPAKSQDISSGPSSDEEFNLNEKESLSEEEMNTDDKDAAALFYNYVAEMVLQANNLVPKPGVKITEVSSDDEKCKSESKKSNKLASEKVCNDLMKLLPKIDLGNKDRAQLEPFSNSRRPLITWWDTPEQLNVRINLKEVKIYQLVVTDEGFNFNTIIAGAQYSSDEKLYDKIHSSDARKYQTLEGINIVVKKHIPFKWPRLNKEKRKFLHIKFDLSHIEDSDTDEQSANAKMQNMRSEYAMDEDSSTTDEEEKYVEPWKDFAQQKSPFSACD